MVTHAHLRAFCLLGGITMADKEFKTIDEQIALLQSRGLIISDKEQGDEDEMARLCGLK